MMGEGAFILLKSGWRAPESAKQAEIALAGVAKILSIWLSWPEEVFLGGLKKFPREVWNYPLGLNWRRFPLDMANSTQFRFFVIWITLLALKRAQYPLRQCGQQIIQVSISKSIQRITFVSLEALAINLGILMRTGMNTSRIYESNRKAGV